ncbi:hypothetical protein K470DRAFT_267902 [Piedraia hortae CBS 480.64]|uniref:Uncharacterized protein n=1 Tax=Piedraia hortae CBS 480.64 TaxID=1314780 RepID=A0A6A7CBH8_9PEZI|nr:hypothetical protein K470DRAFT_267902 [Piedraia hortae CBS 480.64]
MKRPYEVEDDAQSIISTNSSFKRARGSFPHDNDHDTGGDTDVDMDMDMLYDNKQYDPHDNMAMDLDFSSSATRPVQVRQHVRARHPPQQSFFRTALQSSPLPQSSPLRQRTPPNSSPLHTLSFDDDNDEENYKRFSRLSVSDHLEIMQSSSSVYSLPSSSSPPPITPASSSAPEVNKVLRQRQRSGAQSSGSPYYVTSAKRTASLTELNDSTGEGPRQPLRTIRMGFTPDCKRCQMRIPGHLNHFVYSQN